MKVYYDLDLQHFEAWSGAVSTLQTLTYEQINSLEAILEDIYPEGTEETTINDLLWFETDTIADWLGFKSWEALERANNGETDEITVRIYNIEWDTDEDDDAELPAEVTHTFDGYYDTEDDELLDEISDWLSDEYGYCHDGFDIEKVEEEN